MGMKQDEDEQRTESKEDPRRRVRDVAPPHGDRQWASDGASDGEALQLFE
jgi:hypothetical protein